ncbi:hypothetical protein CBS101457_003288 [Exobasidium rhododendri]|nr:hypothetical protein CBS101457_003288 [Exobasidium rhododendri]
MDQLAAYSDDEEEATAAASSAGERQVVKDAGEAVLDTIVAGKSQLEAKETESNVAGSGNAKDQDMIEASTPLSSTVDRTDLHWLAPTPKITKFTNDGSSSSNSDSNINRNVLLDPEWGLGVERPPSGHINEALFAKLSNFQTLKEEQGTHFNQSLAKNRSFRNPHIYDKLVQWVEVEETASGYGDMIKRKGKEKEKADDIWMSSRKAREELKLQGGREVIATLQKRRQEESDERKRKNRRDNIDFIGSAKTSSPSFSSHSKARSESEAMALAESRAQKIRDEMAAKAGRTKTETRRERSKDESSHWHKQEERGESDRHRARHSHRERPP